MCNIKLAKDESEVPASFQAITINDLQYMGTIRNDSRVRLLHYMKKISDPSFQTIYEVLITRAVQKDPDCFYRLLRYQNICLVSDEEIECKVLANTLKSLGEMADIEVDVI